MDIESVRSRLIAVVGVERVLNKEDEMKEYATGSSVHILGLTDKWHYYQYGRYENHYWPDFVVLPDSTEQVSSIMKLANEERIPVIPWGGGSNTHGCTLPVSGGIVVDLRKMDKILEIDKENFTLTAQAGISLLELQDRLNEEGFVMERTLVVRLGPPWGILMLRVPYSCWI